MNIEDLAQMFDGITRGLDAALRDREKKELAGLIGMFRRFPNQGVSDFTRFVEAALSREKNSIPALVERVQAVKQGVGEPSQLLRESLAKIGASDVKKVVTALGLKPGAKKDDNLKLLDSHLSDTQRDGSVISGTAHLDAEIDKAWMLYEGIKTQLRTIGVDEMRSRFGRLAAFPKPVLAGILSRLGYPSDGTKEEVEAKLLDNLTSIKLSYDQTRQIAS